MKKEDFGVVRDAIERFSNRVEAYAKYRPGYPPALIELLRKSCDLEPDCVVADIGSGSGLLTELFLKNGNLVYAVEPNQKMRRAADSLLCHYAGYRSIEACAESTGLGSSSVDFVTVGRALHWFDYEKAFAEFSRILRPGGWIVIVRLQRSNSSPFLADYERLLLTYAKQHRIMKQRKKRLQLLLKAASFEEQTIEDKRLVDFEGLLGQTLSYSVTPVKGHSEYGPMMDALRTLFEQYQRNGKVQFEYRTEVQYASLRSTAEG